jgi:dipeptidyl aminopeptidase/acylaminoacyl peptidase
MATMRDQEILDRAERAANSVVVPDGRFEDLLRRRDRKNRNQRIAAGAVGIAFFVTAVWVITGGPFGRTQTPVGPAEENQPAGSAEAPVLRGRVRGNPPADGVPKVDYVIDLNTDVMAPLPESIIRTAGETAEGSWPAWLRTPRSCGGMLCGDARYVASPDGSLLAYVGTGDEGTPQIFIAGIDGTGVRQMTHDPTGAVSPAWSPDGTMIAYATIRDMGEVDVATNHLQGTVSTGLFVLDVATGESAQVTDGSGFIGGLQFTPDGSSLLYEGVSPTDDCSSRGGCAHLRTVPIAGGPSTVLIGPGTDAWEVVSSAGEGSLSPDGSLVTFNGVGPGDVWHWVANADGTGLQWIRNGCYDAVPGGTWSPDGSRVVCNESLPPTYAVIRVVDLATGDARRVAIGVSATWLDDHTLLVEV